MPAICLSPNGVDHYRSAEPPSSLFVGTTNGVVELARAGSGRWEIGERSLPGIHVSALMLEPAHGGCFAASHGHGIYRRLRGGRWEHASEGLCTDNVFSLNVAEQRGRLVLYAGTEPAYLYRSEDYGTTWIELTALRTIPGREGWDFPAPPHIAHVKNITFSPRNAERVYVAVEQGALLLSADGGRSFRDLPFQDESYIYNRDVHRVVFSPHDPDEMLLSSGDGLARSRDAGETWEHVTTPAMRVGYPDAMFYSPLEKHVIFAMGAATSPGKWRATGSADAAIVRSSDDGGTWRHVTAGLPESLAGNIEAASIAHWPGGFGIYVATTDGEIYAATDSGASWSRLAGGLPAVSKGGHAHNILVGRGVA